jgi:hypothetical protein
MTDGPSVSPEALTRLETITRNEAFARVMGRHGFTGADLRYEGADGERQVIVSRNAYRFISSHNSVQGELREALKTASAKAAEAKAAIIELQKMGSGG